MGRIRGELTGRDKEIVSKYRAGGTTHRKLAAEYGLSSERIRHIIAKAARIEREDARRGELAA